MRIEFVDTLMPVEEIIWSGPAPTFEPITTTMKSVQQRDSILFSLPGELRNAIYNYCFQSSGKLVISACRFDKFNLGVGLLRTCQQINNEVDMSVAFRNNIFSFTNARIMHEWVSRLRPEHANMIHEIEIDLRYVSKGFPYIGQEWLHYLSSYNVELYKKLGSLKADVPSLRALRLNLALWQNDNWGQNGWTYVGTLLNGIRGLDRSTVVGVSSGIFMEKEMPWSPLLFVGTATVGPNHMLNIMDRTLRPLRSGEAKVLFWSRLGGTINLELVVRNSKEAVRIAGENFTTPLPKEGDPWPRNGACYLEEVKQILNLVAETPEEVKQDSTALHG